MDSTWETAHGIKETALPGWPPDTVETDSGSQGWEHARWLSGVRCKCPWGYHLVIVLVRSSSRKQHRYTSRSPCVQLCSLDVDCKMWYMVMMPVESLVMMPVESLVPRLCSALLFCAVLWRVVKGGQLSSRPICSFLGGAAVISVLVYKLMYERLRFVNCQVNSQYPFAWASIKFSFCEPLRLFSLGLVTWLLGLLFQPQPPIGTHSLLVPFDNSDIEQMNYYKQNR